MLEITDFKVWFDVGCVCTYAIFAKNDNVLFDFYKKVQERAENHFYV